MSVFVVCTAGLASILIGVEALMSLKGLPPGVCMSAFWKRSVICSSLRFADTSLLGIVKASIRVIASADITKIGVFGRGVESRRCHILGVLLGREYLAWDIIAQTLFRLCS